MNEYQDMPVSKKKNILLANAKFRKRHTESKTIQFHIEKDVDILLAVKNDKSISFSKLVKNLVRKHYNLASPEPEQPEQE